MHLQLTPAQEERFWSRVDKGDACWIFTGSPSVTYPGFSVGRHVYLAHRVAYAFQVGPIPAGLMVCHTCDTPRCVRPDHLWLGTAADNQADKRRKGRQRYPGAYEPARGQRHGSHTKPWTVHRGATHHAHRHPESRQGERNGRAKFTSESVREIRRRAAAGEDRGELAASFSVARSTINRLVRRETWPLID